MNSAGKESEETREMPLFIGATRPLEEAELASMYRETVRQNSNTRE